MLFYFMVPLTSLFISLKLFFQQPAPALLLKKKVRMRLLKIRIIARFWMEHMALSNSEATRTHHCIARPLDSEALRKPAKGKSLAGTFSVKGLLLDTRVVLSALHRQHRKFATEARELFRKWTYTTRVMFSCTDITYIAVSLHSMYIFLPLR